ncbi:DUF4129 domain-containing protein [Paenibacillus psychroresistens]|uniref:DUF4129 domain-containing protein n=1 Tax=Paenibacillus psychroresistens TaxID=1778678 RepID=A0A6B8RST3_9BACL|nr:DUF4129 domain-containing protein [Paenibacillus psychroresistens]QGQ98278.1 DUF4129 domain-containing protein [Paenibacillus psychroresistens]
MRGYAAAFFTMWLKAAIEILLFFPILFLVHNWIISTETFIWIALLLVFYSLGYLASAWLYLNKWYSLLGVGLSCSCLIVYGGLGLTLSGIFTGLLGFYLFFRGTFIATRAWNNVFPTPIYWLGLGSYFLVSVYYRLQPETRVHLPLLFWLGLISVAITLLVISQERIIQESLPEKNGRHLVNKKQLWHGRIISIAVLCIITIVATVKQLAEGLTYLNHIFWQGVLYIARKISQLFSSPPQEPQPEQTPPPAQLPPAESAEPSAFWMWVEKILYIVVIAVVCVVALYLIYILGKRLIRLGRLLYNWLNRRLNQDGIEQETGYEDESTSLTSWGDLIKSYGSKASNWLERMRKREVKWSDLTTNAEKARYLYRLFVMKSLSKSTKIDSHLTAQEMILTIQQRMPELSDSSEQLASLYNQARYSDHPIQDEDITKLKNSLKSN